MCLFIYFAFCECHINQGRNNSHTTEGVDTPKKSAFHINTCCIIASLYFVCKTRLKVISKISYGNLELNNLIRGSIVCFLVYKNVLCSNQSNPLLPHPGHMWGLAIYFPIYR